MKNTKTISGLKENLSKASLPLYVDKISCGFPSPASNYMEKKLDLNEHLIKNRASTFIVRAMGDSMEPLILEGDELIVDRLEEPKNKNIVIAIVDGEFTMKRLIIKGHKKYLKAENHSYNIVEITDAIEIWGVVQKILRSV